MKYAFITSLFFLVVLTACKKKDANNLPTQYSSYDYFPMDSGNYWIYEWYKIDSNGNESHFTWSNDTILATGDTVINGVVWKKIKSTGYGSTNFTTTYYRDSIGILIGLSGFPILAVNPNVDTLYTYCNTSGPNLCEVYFMNYNTRMKTVPAGTFSVIERKRALVDYTGATNCIGTNVRYATQTYCVGVGKISDRIFYSSDQNCEYYEARLKNYFVH